MPFIADAPTDELVLAPGEESAAPKSGFIPDAPYSGFIPDKPTSGFIPDSHRSEPPKPSFLSRVFSHPNDIPIASANDPLIRYGASPEIPSVAGEESQQVGEPAFRISDEHRQAIGEQALHAALGPLAAPLLATDKGKQVAGGIGDAVSGMLEGATTPEGQIMVGASVIPGASTVLKGLIAGMGAKAAGEKLGESSVTGNVRTATEGIVSGVAGVLPALEHPLSVIAEAKAAGLPASAETLKQIESRLTTERDALLKELEESKPPPFPEETNAIQEQGSATKMLRNEEAQPKEQLGPLNWTWKSTSREKVGEGDSQSQGAQGTGSQEAITVYHGGPPDALESNWPKWFTTNKSEAESYAKAGGITQGYEPTIHEAKVSPKNPLYSKVSLSVEDVKKAFSEGHDAVIIGSKDNPIHVILADNPSEETVASPPAMRAEVPGPIQDRVGVTPSASLANAFQGIADIGTVLEGKLRQISGETMPKTTMADQPAGEAGARYGSSQIGGPYAARSMSHEVLPKTSGVDPDLLGAAMTEHNLRGTRKSRQMSANAARAAGNIEEAKMFQDLADAVTTLVGKSGVFKTEADLQAFVRRPEVQFIVAKSDDLYAQRLDPLAASAGLDITRKPQTGDLFPNGFINLFIPEEGGVPSTRTVSGVNPVATMKRGTKFQLRRTGASDKYGVNYHDMVANAYSGFLEVARKNEFDAALVKSGLAVISDTKPGPGYTFFPYERGKLIGIEEGEIAFKKSLRKNIWVRDDIAQEYSIVSNLYRNQFSNVAAVLSGRWATRFQMLGIMDAAYHTRALLKGLAESPMTGKGIYDPIWSAAFRADLIPKVSRLIEATFLDPLQRGQRLADLANIGALSAHESYSWKSPVKSAVRFTEENVRLALSGIFDDLAKDGRFPNTETARREFVNRGLQYNMRFQGPVMRLLRQTAIGPFATAGRAGLARGIRRYGMMEWAPPNDVPSRAWVAANVLGKMAGTTLVVGTLNQLITGEWAGRSGTPLGNVDTGTDGEDGRPISVSVADMMGNEVRGAKALGLRALATSKMQELDANQTAEAMWRESINTLIHPMVGPLPQAAYGAATGKQIGVDLPDYPETAPGESKIANRLQTAAEKLNPVVVGGIETAIGKEPKQPPVEGSLSALGIQKGTKPQSFENAAKIKDAAQLRRFIDFVAGEARKKDKTDRREFIREQRDRIEDPKMRRQFDASLQRIHPGLLKYQ